MAEEKQLERKPLAFLFIDIEARGRWFEKNGLLSIGALLVPAQSLTLDDPKAEAEAEAETEAETETLRINIRKRDDQEFDGECFSEFWSKHLDILTELQKDVVSEQEALRLFVDKLDVYEQRFDLIVIGDYLMYDAVYLGALLQKHGHRDLMYNKDGSVRKHIDFASYRMGLMSRDITKPEKMNTSRFLCGFDDKEKQILDKNRTHLPDEDCVFLHNLVKLSQKVVESRLKTIQFYVEAIEDDKESDFKERVIEAATHEKIDKFAATVFINEHWNTLFFTAAQNWLKNQSRHSVILMVEVCLKQQYIEFHGPTI